MIRMLDISMCKVLCDHMFSFPLGVYRGVEQLGQRVTRCWTFWGTSDLCSKEAAPFYDLRSSISGSQCLHTLSRTRLLFVFLLIAILVGVKRCLISVLTYLSLLTNVHHLFTCLLDTCVSVQRNIYSNTLCICKLGCLPFFFFWAVRLLYIF